MKKLIVMVSLLIVTVTSCDLLNEMNEATKFVNCNFTVNTVAINRIGDVDFTDYKSVNDVNFTEMLVLGQKVIAGNLQANLSVDIRAKNNQSTKAAISGLDWQLYMKNEQYGSGNLLDYVEVLPGQSTDFTVNVNFDLLKLLKSENLQTILDLVMDLENKEKLQKLDLMLKVKPYYKSGGSVREFPSYITIRP